MLDELVYNGEGANICGSLNFNDPFQQKRLQTTSNSVVYIEIRVND